MTIVIGAREVRRLIGAMLVLAMALAVSACGGRVQGTVAERQAALFAQLYGENTAVWPQGKAEEYQQLQAQIQNRRSAYRQQCATYEAMWLDDWRREVAPSGVPTVCPVLE